MTDPIIFSVARLVLEFLHALRAAYAGNATDKARFPAKPALVKVGKQAYLKIQTYRKALSGMRFDDDAKAEAYEYAQSYLDQIEATQFQNLKRAMTNTKYLVRRSDLPIDEKDFIVSDIQRAMEILKLSDRDSYLLASHTVKLTRMAIPVNNPVPNLDAAMDLITALLTALTE